MLLLLLLLLLHVQLSRVILQHLLVLLLLLLLLLLLHRCYGAAAAAAAAEPLLLLQLLLLQRKQRVMRRESCCSHCCGCCCAAENPLLRLQHCLEIAALGPIDTPSSDLKPSMGIILQRADAPRFPIGWLLPISIGPADAAHRKTSAPKISTKFPTKERVFRSSSWKPIDPLAPVVASPWAIRLLQVTRRVSIPERHAVQNVE